MNIVNIFLNFLGEFDPPRGSHLGFVHTILAITRRVPVQRAAVERDEIPYP